MALVGVETGNGTPIATNPPSLARRITCWSRLPAKFPRARRQVTESEQSTFNLDKGSVLRKIDLPFLIASMLTGFLALGNDSWWTVRGLASSSILNVRVSPFYVQIDALGVPPTVPNALLIGSATRILLASTTIALALVSFWPRSVWRKPVFWFSICSLAEAYLSFALLVHSTQVLLLNTFAVVPPLSGNVVIQGRVLGQDLSSYLNPTINASIGIVFFVGLANLSILGGSGALRFIVHSRARIIMSDSLSGLSGVYLSPPYRHAWFTSNDQSLNPLGQDPDNLTDDELAESFDKLHEKMLPGGLVSVILPAWATSLNDRLVRVVPWTGFHLEKTELIYRVPGRPENEILFRKPVITQQVRTEQEDPQPSTPLQTLEVGPIQVGSPPVMEVVEEPIWAGPRLTRQELSMIKSAVGVIERRREPVVYKELLNEVYMDLLDKKVDFESAKQIETTLLKHAGNELVIMEDLDETGNRVVRKWWLGETRVRAENSRTTRLWSRLAAAKKGVPRIHQLLNKWQRPKRSGYRRRREAEEDYRT